MDLEVSKYLLAHFSRGKIELFYLIIYLFSAMFRVCGSSKFYILRNFNDICGMQKLNFPEYSFRFKNSENKPLAFDDIRKKFVVLTPEEWVRLHVVQFLIIEKKFPKSLINVEKQLKINNITKRYDVVVFNSDGSIFLIVECKAPSIPITQITFDQIARYNLTLRAEYLMVTNGLEHYFCQMDFENQRYVFLKDIPER